MQETPETLKFAVDAVGLLSGQDFFRNDEGLIDLLVKCLVSNADNLPHIEAMVKRWVLTTRATLHPSDVPALADATANPPRVDGIDLPGPCGKCLNGDWPTVVERHGQTAVDRCDCARGQRLLASDKERIARPLPAPVDDGPQLRLFDILESIAERL